MAQWREWLSQYWYVPLLIVLAAGFWWWQNRPVAAPIEPLVASSSAVSSTVPASSSASSSNSRPQSGYVHLKGAVARPGLYPVTGETRWDAVVKAAGGLTAEADITQINLAKIAVDQESLYIPAKGETVAQAPPAPDTGGPTSAAGASGGLINLNTATLAELQTLSGVGPKKAADIIAYREANGSFQSVGDLANVSGIGAKTVEKLTPFVTVGP
ncbi:helix-hairpin-helix domain-containing protein [Lacticaseibacillus daqingensis]|uniref:helix-hairpin-helix domain-containing protein n=1 Tax=Lacticaseibacillus daqingensis TaxID=2486014 RepID=UPI000F7B6FD5|nr:helix-hairpin-helix domain-containing protein [Lacticaseibacillus daqingensis]